MNEVQQIDDSEQTADDLRCENICVCRGYS